MPRLSRLALCLLLASLALLGLACGPSESAPRWVPLAQGFQPQTLPSLIERWQREAGLGPIQSREDENSILVSHPLPPAAWTRDAARDTWLAAMPRGAFDHGLPRFLQLRSELQPVVPLPPGSAPRPNAFRVQGGRIELHLAPDTQPAPDLVLTARLESGRMPADGVWQVRLGNECGAGIPAWSGVGEEVVAELPARSRLTFRVRYASTSEGPVTLRVRLDGEIVYEVHETSGALASGRWESFVLPDRARVRARFAFEAEGPPGLALFLHPIVGPAEFGARGARPWTEARPDIVLFLADTFRADGLAAWGGAPELAPALNRLGAGAVRFLNARSNAAWTLPSIGTLLTGLAPGQHTANDSAHALPGDLTTIAEALAEAGYRTGAVTDAAYFTPTHGLEQGFESFAMNSSSSWDIDWSVERAREFLAHDDGRPLFLLVHSYRAHMPYRVGPDEDLRPWHELLESGCALLRLKGKIPREEWEQRLVECRERYIDLYHAGVRDLDRGFGELLADLEHERFSAHGYQLFTSDHGEALGENHDLFHDGDLWESKLRIPLLLSGPGLTPRDVTPAVTLLDVTPTLAELAGLARDPRWSGSSLLSVGAERPACAFLLKKAPQIVVLDHGRKLFAGSAQAFERGEYDSAYDLGTDPGEEQPVTDPTWPAELARRNAALVEALLVPASLGAEARLSLPQRRELGALGYGGEDGDE